MPGVKISLQRLANILTDLCDGLNSGIEPVLDYDDGWMEAHEQDFVWLHENYPECFKHF